MHKDILSQKQAALLPLLKSYKNDFYLAGGTAIALQTGFRRSIDFDLFKNTEIIPTKIINHLKSFEHKYKVVKNTSDQFDAFVYGVKLSFIHYPFRVATSLSFNNIIRMPDLLTLAAMKAYALGRRSKWKDYVDLYFLLKHYFSVKEISGKANEIFGELFSEKLFRAQLSYHKDIDYSEQIDYINEPVSPDDIKTFLINKVLDINQ